MKLKIFSFVLLLITIIPSFSANAATTSISQKLKGKILLQIESHGEAWYVNPATAERYYMANGNEAYNIMRTLGIGITNVDLNKIKANKFFAKKSSGKIFLQVESKGEAYYIDFNGVAHYLKDGSAAYEIMRSLGLGITNANLEQILSANPINTKIITDNKNTPPADKVFSKKLTGTGNLISDGFYLTDDKIKIAYTFKAKPSAYGFFYGEQGVDGHDFITISVRDEENKLISGCQDFKAFNNIWSSYFVCKTGNGTFHINIESKVTTNWNVSIDSYK